MLACLLLLLLLLLLRRTCWLMVPPSQGILWEAVERGADRMLTLGLSDEATSRQAGAMKEEDDQAMLLTCSSNLFHNSPVLISQASLAVQYVIV
jgi:hypothetical protein